MRVAAIHVTGLRAGHGRFGHSIQRHGNERSEHREDAKKQRAALYVPFHGHDP